MKVGGVALAVGAGQMSLQNQVYLLTRPSDLRTAKNWYLVRMNWGDVMCTVPLSV